MTLRGLALDRTARRIDADGRLHVTLANISKANICPYYGREIPGSEVLGLDPGKIYHLLRDPAELARAAPTFCNMPIMDNHVAQSADDPQKEFIAGSTGTDCVFEAPYLKVSLVIWVAESIDKIESEEQREISCGYRYEPDMTPGEYEGLHYDGIMRNIVANHVALVKEGRAGPDVVVADSQIKVRPMLKSKLALMARGALAVQLRPLLAADAKIDLTAALDGVNRANFAAMKPVVIGRITMDAKDKLIPGASLTFLSGALDAMEEEKVEGEDEEPETEEEKAARVEREARDKRAKDRKAHDGETEEQREEREEAEDAMEEAEDAAMECDPAKDRRARDRKTARDKRAMDRKTARDKRAGRDDANSGVPPMKPEGMDKAAMDAAIRTGVAEGLAAGRALDAAKAEVAPLVGEVHACDTAEKVYKFALDAAQVPTAGVHPSAYQAMFRMHTKTVTQANDAAPIVEDAGDSFFAEFPDARRFAR